MAKNGFVRAYVFIERTRSLKLTTLEQHVGEHAKRKGSGIVTAVNIWGQYDMLAVVEGASLSEVHGSVDQLITRCDGAIGDVTTYVAVEPRRIEEWPNRPNVVAFDTFPGKEMDVRDSLLDALEGKGLFVADVVFGIHDIIALFPEYVGADEYVRTFFPEFEKILAIQKTRTMFALPGSFDEPDGDPPDWENDSE